jgi:hypothetical protein
MMVSGIAVIPSSREFRVPIRGVQDANSAHHNGDAASEGSGFERFGSGYDP